jgi:hypothetical protein
MVTIAPDDDEDGRTDGCVRGGGSTTGRANAERSNVDARRGSVANGETRKEDARERERVCVVLRRSGISRTKTRTSFVCDARTEFLKI